MKRILMGSAALLLLTPAAALAAHGKVGLWTISSTMSMPDMPQMPPEAMAMMRARGMSMPGMGAPVVSQICMTEAEVNSDRPPDMNRPGSDCTTKIDSMTGSSMSTTSVCKSAQSQGTGHMQIAYSSAEHYSGSYNFQGVAEGHPANMSMSFKGDWVKADCGAVKPGVAPAH